MTIDVASEVVGVVERVRSRLSSAASDPSPARILDLVHEEAPLLSSVDAARAADAVVADVEGLGALQPLLADRLVSDILVNGGGRSVWIERAGRLMETGIVLSGGEVERLIERIVAPLGLRADRASPLVDARLPDGSRVHAVVPPLAVDGPCLTIRRFSVRSESLAAFAGPTVVGVLDRAVAGGASIVVAGGAGAGKTTLLNALAASIPVGERIITVEDAAELRLPQPHVVRLESRPANAEGAGRVTVRELVRNALRMRPDRLLVGECRGGEALDMLQAMNTGHEGSMTTCHANGCDDALRRLETMVLLADSGLPLAAVREQLASSVDLVVFVVRGRDGARRIASVAEVVESSAGSTAGSAGSGGSDDGGRLRVLVRGDDVVASPVRPRVVGGS